MNNLIKELLLSLEHARNEQVLYEFVDCLLLEYSYSSDIISAIQYASREWDL